MGIMTVNGIIGKAELGITTPHEHALIDIGNQYPGERSPQNPGWTEKVSRRHYELLMKDPYALCDNLRLDDKDTAIAEVKRFADAGGKTFVDVTTPCIGRDVKFLKRLADETGLNVVAACGFYTADAHQKRVAAMSAEAIADEFTRELDEGIDDTGIRAGIIGEIGTSQTLYDEEVKVLRAAAIAHTRTGTPVMVHLNPWAKHALKVIDILEAGGVEPEKTCLCHLDVLLDLDDMRAVLKRGAYVEFDNFGKEFTSGSAYGRFPSDAERLEVLYRLADDGFTDQLLASCDVCLKNLLTIHGGPGYAHVIGKMAALIREQRNDAEALLQALLVDNPARYLDNPALAAV